MRTTWCLSGRHPGGRVSAVTAEHAPARLSPMLPLRWNLGYGVTLAFSEAGDGDLRQAAPREAWLEDIGVPHPCTVPLQVHGALVVSTSGGDLARADGLVTADPHRAIGVFGADCPGLCIAAADALGVAHCGWRGTAAGIVGNLVAAMRDISRQTPDQWRAFIGPGIGGPEYEVDEPVLTARDWPPGALTPRPRGRASLDLAEAISADLAAAGVGAALRAGVCTRRDPRLHSYRWQGPGPTQLLVAWRTAA
jgi:copper oxidase (laccase) domain-containing protein